MLVNKRRAHLWEGSCLAGDVLDCPRQPLLEGDVASGGDDVEQLGPVQKRNNSMPKVRTLLMRVLKSSLDSIMR